MFKQILAFTLSVVLFILIYKAAEIDDAEAAFSDLRQSTNNSLNAAFLEYENISAATDLTALDIIEAEADLLTCVIFHSVMALDAMFISASELVSMALEMISDEEISIIKCGRSDAQCLTGVTAEIQKATSELNETVPNKLENGRKEINSYITMITDCATKKYIHS